MAKLKILKMPKAPKATASCAVKEAYLKKLADVKRENLRRAAENKRSNALSQKIAQARANFRKAA